MQKQKTYLMGKSTVSDTFALKSIHWTDDSWCGLRLELRIASVALARCCKSLHNWPLDLAFMVPQAWRPLCHLAHGTLVSLGFSSRCGQWSWLLSANTKMNVMIIWWTASRCGDNPRYQDVEVPCEVWQRSDSVGSSSHLFSHVFRKLHSEQCLVRHLWVQLALQLGDPCALAFLRHHEARTFNASVVRWVPSAGSAAK